MRENRLYGSEGGVAKAIPTPIRPCARGLRLRAGRDEETGFKSNQETGPTAADRGPCPSPKRTGKAPRLPPDHPYTKKRTDHELRKPDNLTS
jgi:hypothetical protein